MTGITHIDKDTFLNRIAVYNGMNGNKKLNIVLTVEAIAPICITLDDRIDELAFKSATSNVPESNATKLEDTEYKTQEKIDRYIYMGSLKSPMSLNVLFMYYDKKYKDILFVPDLRFLELSTPNKTFGDIRCYRIGSGAELSKPTPNSTITLDESRAYSLPEPKTGLSPETKLVGMPGYGIYHDRYGGGFEELVDNKINLLHDNRKLGTVVKLGRANEIFNNPNSLPIYLLYQYGVLDYGLKYLNVMNTENKVLYLLMRF